MRGAASTFGSTGRGAASGFAGDFSSGLDSTAAASSLAALLTR